MKTLFVNPSLRPNAPHRYLPVGLGYVVSAAKRAGFNFDLLDVDIGGYSDEYVEKFLTENKYDVIALGAIVTHYKWIKWFINTAKKIQPECKVIVGNSVGSSIPEVLFNTSGVDIIVLGEGDITIVETLNAIKDGKSLGEANQPIVEIPHNNIGHPACVEGTGIEGIVFRDTKGNIVHNGRRKAVRIIDEIPTPDWDIFDIESYIERSRGTAHSLPDISKEETIVMPINTARGCVFKCTFCHYVFWHDPYRHRSSESIIEEIKFHNKKYGANYFNFWDELSFHKLGPTEKFLDAMIAEDLGVYWTAAIRSDLFGRPETPREEKLRVAEKFIKAGNFAVGYSLESGNDEILKAMNKRVEAQYFANQSKLLKEVGVTQNTSLVVGYPQETPETIKETMDMCRNLHIYPSVGFLLPLPETGMWGYAVENGYIKHAGEFLDSITERQDIILNMTKMTDEQMLSEVKTHLARINEEVNGVLDSDSLIRTGGYSRHNKHQDKKKIDNQSFNPATTTGSV